MTWLAFTANASVTVNVLASNDGLFAYQSTNDPNDLWERIRSGFALTAYDDKEVRKNEASYTRSQIHIDQITARSKYYLYYIVEEVERRGMPLEIALLPIVESAFDPKAKSGSNAAGLWQFTASTGKGFGLAQNRWHDDRKDVLAATHAALDYLQYLHNKFGDWKLALAAYNWGQGALGRALDDNRKKGLPASFHHLKLPVETSNHVHKLIAIKNIVANPAAFGIKLDAIPNKPYFAVIDVDNHIDIALVARLANISIKKFNKLNPAYKQAVIKVTDSPRQLLLPLAKASIFLRNIEAYDKSRLTRGNDIAADVTIVRRKPILKAGVTVVYKLPIVRRKPAFKVTATIVRKKLLLSQQVDDFISIKQFIYIVKKGDTLSEIAGRYGITVKQIKLWNSNNERLAIGQKLVLIVKSLGTIGTSQKKTV